MLLSLVIPFYNEEQNANSVVQGLLGILGKFSDAYELILVNNGSNDMTPQLLENLSIQHPHTIKLVNVPINQGFGWGIISGLKTAKGEFVGYMSGDGQIEPGDVARVFETVIAGGCDMVKIKRVIRHDGNLRKLMSVAFNKIFFITFNVNSSDINGHPKMFKRHLFEMINPVSKDWFIDAEIMIKAMSLKANVKEVEVEFLRREEGKSHVAFNTVVEFVNNMFSYKIGRGMQEWTRKTLK